MPKRANDPHYYSFPKDIEKQFLAKQEDFSGPLVGLKDYTHKSGINGYSIISMLVYQYYSDILDVINKDKIQR